MGYNRPRGFMNHEMVIQELEKSIETAKHWGEVTFDAFGSEERVESLETLINIVVELAWRYDESAMFCFTAKRKFPGMLPLSEVLFDEAYEPWNHRVFVSEIDMTKPKIYIKF